MTAAVIVTTPQKLAFIDVAKGVRMFSKLKVSTQISFSLWFSYLNFCQLMYPIFDQVPCVAVVENMCHFDADGKRYYPFGRGSGAEVWESFTKSNIKFILNKINH